VATGKSERALGDRWAAKLRARGWLVQKLPSSALAGLPDWLVVHAHAEGTWLVEAKKLRAAGRWAFLPSQCTRAQRFFLEVIARAGGKTAILVLGPESWMLVSVCTTVQRVSRTDFEHAAEEY